MLNVGGNTSGSSSALRSVSDVRLVLGVRDPNRIGRRLAVSNVSATASAMYCRSSETTSSSNGGRRSWMMPANPAPGSSRRSPDVLAMKDGAHAGHLLSRGRV